MAGSLPGIANSQRVDGQGKPLVGGLLYLYEAGTVMPATAFKDFNLTAGQEYPFPIALDAYGQIPPFYLADGFYRARLTSASGGTVLFDELQLPAVGNQSGGGGTPPTIDPTTIFQTGDELWVRKSGARSGWVRGNGRTIGNATSGASERANNDCQSLFLFYWNNFSDTLNPVIGGRGASAAADWDAGKQITLPDYKGKMDVGANQMGSGVNGSNNDTSFTTPDTVGTTGGASQVTIAKENLPSYDLSVTIPSGQGEHDHSVPSGGPNTDTYNGGGVASGFHAPQTTGKATLPAMTGTAPLGGSGTVLNNMPTAVVKTCYIKL